MTRPREQVIVTVATDGSVVATTHGIKGERCLDYISLLEDILEADTASSNFTSEYGENMQSRDNEVSNDLRQW